MSATFVSTSNGNVAGVFWSAVKVGIIRYRQPGRARRRRVGDVGGDFVHGIRGRRHGVDERSGVRRAWERRSDHTFEQDTEIGAQRGEAGDLGGCLRREGILDVLQERGEGMSMETDEVSIICCTLCRESRKQRSKRR